MKKSYFLGNVPPCRDEMFCRDLASTVISLYFSHLGYMMKFLPGKAGSRLHVNGISAKRDDFSPSNTHTFSIEAFSKKSLSCIADETAATGEGAVVEDLLNEK